MSSTNDIVAVTTSALQALEAINSPNHVEVTPDDLSNAEVVEVLPGSIDLSNRQTEYDVNCDKENAAREISPQLPENEVEIINIKGSTTRFRDRTLGSQESTSSIGLVNVETEKKQRKHGDGIRITRFTGSTKECRQKLASRKKFSDASCYRQDFTAYPKVVQAQVIPQKRSSQEKSNIHSSIEKATWDQFEKENQQNHNSDQTAIISAATSAAAAAAVGTQPVLKEIESRINELTNKLTSLEAAGKTSFRESEVARAPMRMADRDMEERLLRELAVERELAKERERQRKREEHRREKDNEKFQRRMIALTALQSRTQRAREERKSLPLHVETPMRRPHILEEILHKEEAVGDNETNWKTTSSGIGEGTESNTRKK